MMVVVVGMERMTLVEHIQSIDFVRISVEVKKYTVNELVLQSKWDKFMNEFKESKILAIRTTDGAGDGYE